MQSVQLTPDIEDQVIGALGKTIFFSSLNTDQARWVVEHCKFFKSDAKETVVKQGDPSDCFYLLLKGRTRVLVQQADSGEAVEVGKLAPPRAIGEIGILLDQPRTATVVADEQCLLLRFDEETFGLMFDKVKGFGQAVCSALARRLDEVSRKIPMASAEGEDLPDPDVVALLPLGFIQRHRVLPLKLKGKLLQVGLVDDLNPALMNKLRQMLPGMNVDPVAITSALFDRVLRGYGTGGKPTMDRLPGAEDQAPEPAAPMPSGPVDLGALLQRMVDEGASDLHLSAGHRPRWRLDGEMIELTQLAELGVQVRPLEGHPAPAIGGTQQGDRVALVAVEVRLPRRVDQGDRGRAGRAAAARREDQAQQRSQGERAVGASPSHAFSLPVRCPVAQPVSRSRAFIDREMRSR